MSVNDMRVGKKNDKRNKVTTEIKNQILEIWWGQDITISALSRMFNLSRTQIKCIVDPDYKKRCYEYNRVYNREHSKDKDKYNNIMQRHRDYKRQLHKEGKI